MHCNKLGEKINQRWIIDMICIYFIQSVTHYCKKQNNNNNIGISNSIDNRKICLMTVIKNVLKHTPGKNKNKEYEKSITQNTVLF